MQCTHRTTPEYPADRWVLRPSCHHCRCSPNRSCTAPHRKSYSPSLLRELPQHHSAWESTIHNHRVALEVPLQRHPIGRLEVQLRTVPHGIHLHNTCGPIKILSSSSNGEARCFLRAPACSHNREHIALMGDVLRLATLAVARSPHCPALSSLGHELVHAADNVRAQPLSTEINIHCNWWRIRYHSLAVAAADASVAAILCWLHSGHGHLLPAAASWLLSRSPRASPRFDCPSKHVLDPCLRTLVWDNVSQSPLCWAVSFPGLQRCLRFWLCALAVCEIWPHPVSTSMPHLCVSAFRFPVCEECVQWLKRQWPTLVSSRTPGLPATTQFLSTPTLPMLPHTALPLHCSSQWSSVFVCTPSRRVHRASPHRRSTTSESPCSLPSPSP